MLLPVLFLLAALCSAQDLNSAARELARKIGRQEIASLTVRNSSALSESEVAEVTRAIETELRVRPRSEGSSVNVTLSETQEGYLWVAEIVRGEQRDVVFVSVPRTGLTPVAPASITIEKQLLWEQGRPILDLATAGSLMIILEPTNVSIYRERLLISSLPILSVRPMSRDPRGRLAMEGDSFRAFLPGMVCSGTIAPTPAMNCVESSGPGMASGRNYFNEPPLPPFFSSASLPGPLRIVAGVDGRARMYDSSMRELASIAGWGSDIAALESGCRSGRQILASKPGDGGDPDAIQGYEVNGRRFVAAGDPVTFPGPITALWPSASPAGAIAVARNSETGRYAAYSLAITCSR